MTATASRTAHEPGRGRDKRRRILAAAQEVFAEQGFDAARMEEVARRARVGKGTLYHYCDSKEDLLIQAVIASMEEVRDRIAAAVEPSQLQPIRSLEDVLRMLIVDHIPLLARRFHSLYNQVWGVIARPFRRLVARMAPTFPRERPSAVAGMASPLGREKVKPPPRACRPKPPS